MAGLGKEDVMMSRRLVSVALLSTVGILAAGVVDAQNTSPTTKGHRGQGGGSEGSAAPGPPSMKL